MNKSLDISNHQFDLPTERKSNVETKYCIIIGSLFIFDMKTRKIESPILTTSTFFKDNENGAKSRK